MSFWSVKTDMASLRLIGHQYVYPVSDILRLFFGVSRQVAEDLLQSGPELPLFTSRLEPGQTEAGCAGVRVSTEGAGCHMQAEVPESLARREIKRQLYQILAQATGFSFPWGSLTGIRPTQVAAECLQHHLDLPAARDELIGHWYVSAEKADLALETSAEEQALLARIPQDSLLVYLGVPFCPSRCAYCSFITQDALHHAGRLEPYVEAMIRETDVFFTSVRKPISALYLGGGTPTSLPDALFRRLLTGILPLIPLASGAELTVEAGRPDTITATKLDLIRTAGATRLCINPQTFHDKTLERIGRHHTTEQTIKAYRLARAMGFDKINMDLIAGLPGEEPEDFADSLHQAILLEPDSITVHTLAIKRSSQLDRDADSRKDLLSDHRPISGLAAMLAEARQMLATAGLMPYYLYRQKDVAGGLENTGFARPGEGCLYNVGMMSDRRSVVGLGSGAMSKRVFGAKLERLPNPRDLAVYIDRVESLAARKATFFLE